MTISGKQFMSHNEITNGEYVYTDRGLHDMRKRKKKIPTYDHIFCYVSLSFLLLFIPFLNCTCNCIEYLAMMMMMTMTCEFRDIRWACHLSKLHLRTLCITGIGIDNKTNIYKFRWTLGPFSKSSIAHKHTHTRLSFGSRWMRVYIFDSENKKQTLKILNFNA